MSSHYEIDRDDLPPERFGARFNPRALAVRGSKGPPSPEYADWPENSGPYGRWLRTALAILDASGVRVYGARRAQAQMAPWEFDLWCWAARAPKFRHDPLAKPPVKTLGAVQKMIRQRQYRSRLRQQPPEAFDDLLR